MSKTRLSALRVLCVSCAGAPQEQGGVEYVSEGMQMPLRRKPERRRNLPTSCDRQDGHALVARVGFPVVHDLLNACMRLS
jgi:hypothetical protein